MVVVGWAEALWSFGLLLPLLWVRNSIISEYELQYRNTRVMNKFSDDG